MISAPLTITTAVDLVQESNIGEVMKNFAERLEARMKEMGCHLPISVERAG